MQVPVVEILEVTVWDSDEFMNDACLGVVEIDIAEDVAKVAGGRIYKTWYLQVQAASPPAQDSRLCVSKNAIRAFWSAASEACLHAVPSCGVPSMCSGLPAACSVNALQDISSPCFTQGRMNEAP